MVDESLQHHLRGRGSAMLQQSVPCPKHRSSLPSPGAIECQRGELPTEPSQDILNWPTPHTFTNGRPWLEVVKLHRQSANTVGRPMTCSGHTRRCVSGERALELPLSIFDSHVENTGRRQRTQFRFCACCCMTMCSGAPVLSTPVCEPESKAHDSLEEG